MSELEVSYLAPSGMYKFTCDACSTTIGHHDLRTTEDYASYHATYCQKRQVARQSAIGVISSGPIQGVPGPAKECETCCIPGATAATGRCGHGHLYRSKVRDPAPVPCPALYDGITAEQCLELYVERQQEHGDSADCYMMTPRQLAAARELWSAQLRAKREAAKEKERRAVTYCEVDPEDPW